MSTNLSRGEREGLLQNQLSRDADSGHIQYSCLYCGRDDFRRLQSLRTHMNLRCEFNRRTNNRDRVEERLNGELSSNSSTMVVEQLIEAAGLLESGGRYIVGNKEVPTSADSRHQTSYDTCMTDAKFGLINEQYNDDHSKILSFSCQMCENSFRYTGRRTMSRHIHACCTKYPVKANAFGLATGTCLSCLQGKICERNSTTAAPASTSSTTTSGTETSLEDIPIYSAVVASTSLFLLLYPLLLFNKI
jgi:hypothetical protein